MALRHGLRQPPRLRLLMDQSLDIYETHLSIRAMAAIFQRSLACTEMIMGRLAIVA